MEGQQTSAAKNPSSISRFIARSLRNRSSTAETVSHSWSVSGRSSAAIFRSLTSAIHRPRMLPPTTVRATPMTRLRQLSTSCSTTIWACPSRRQQHEAVGGPSRFRFAHGKA